MVTGAWRRGGAGARNLHSGDALGLLRAQRGGEDAQREVADAMEVGARSCASPNHGDDRTEEFGTPASSGVRGAVDSLQGRIVQGYH